MNSYELYLVNADAMLSKVFSFAVMQGCPRNSTKERMWAGKKRAQPAARFICNSTMSVVLKRRKSLLHNQSQFFHSVSEQDFLSGLLYVGQLDKLKNGCIQPDHSPSS